MVALPPDYHLIHLTEVDSTNAEAARLAMTGEARACWIVADQQTAGRGRRGRQWYSPVGNLMTTLYLPFSLTPEQAGQMAFVAGLALHHTVCQFAPAQANVRLKWPNDVLVNGAKVSGILLETASAKKRMIDWLAIGMGLNLAHHPSDTPYPAISLARVCDTVPDNLTVLFVLAAAFDRVYRQWQKMGFAAILQAWRQVAQNIGGPVTVRLDSETLEGVFEDIEASGSLLLGLPHGDKRVIAAGDIFFPDLA